MILMTEMMKMRERMSLRRVRKRKMNNKKGKHHKMEEGRGKACTPQGRGDAM